MNALDCKTAADWLAYCASRSDWSQGDQSKVMLSYNGDDSKYKEQLRKHLAPALTQVIDNQTGKAFEIWDFAKRGSGVHVGQFFPVEVAENMWRCRAAVVVLSPDYIESEYCFQIELPFLLWRWHMKEIDLFLFRLNWTVFDNRRIELPKFRGAEGHVQLSQMVDDRNPSLHLRHDPNNEIIFKQLHEERPAKAEERLTRFSQGIAESVELRQRMRDRQVSTPIAHAAAMVPPVIETITPATSKAPMTETPESKSGRRRQATRQKRFEARIEKDAVAVAANETVEAPHPIVVPTAPVIQSGESKEPAPKEARSKSGGRGKGARAQPGAAVAAKGQDATTIMETAETTTPILASLTSARATADPAEPMAATQEGDSAGADRQPVEAEIARDEKSAAATSDSEPPLMPDFVDGGAAAPDPEQAESPRKRIRLGAVAMLAVAVIIVAAGISSFMDTMKANAALTEQITSQEAQYRQTLKTRTEESVAAKAKLETAIETINQLETTNASLKHRIEVAEMELKATQASKTEEITRAVKFATDTDAIYGAAARSNSGRVYNIDRQRSQEEAEGNVLAMCRGSTMERSVSGCRILTSYSNRCFVIAREKNVSPNTPRFAWTLTDDRQKAHDDVVNDCQKSFGRSCKVTYSDCSPDFRNSALNISSP